MLGSIDCMHWEWTNCPKALHGQFKRRDHKYPTIMLKAVVDQQLWIWHAYFGVPGANNDLNVLYGSPLFYDLLADKSPEVPFVVNEKTYEKDKSPGLDGFTFGFYRRFWNLIEGDVVEAVNHFFNNVFFVIQEAKKKQTLIFKVDFEKAFDSVRWDFLDDVLNYLGFGSRWRDWIRSCLNSSKGKSALCSFSKGLLSGLYKGVVLDNSLQISHLFYADDVVFIGQWCDSNVSTIIRVLDCFFQASGMRINLHKSKIMGIAVDNSLVTQAANSIGCLTLSLPFQYLGVNIGSHMSRIKSWDIVLNKVQGRLSKWKSKVLSVGGRLTLLKSVLGVTPIYYMSMYKAPMYVINKLEAIRSHFFNGGDPNIRKMTFVKWENVLASKDKGGMGVSSFFALNRALIFKWIWRFHSQGFSLWSSVIKAIQGRWKSLGIDLLDTLRKRLFALELDKKISMAGKMAQPSLITSFRRNPRSGDEEFSVSSARILIDDKTLGTVVLKRIGGLQIPRDDPGY
ncbi:RNA-directed DNA polymerase, eukaryota, reverse transcriptase zinc-binding domain protein [Tanacetum coccineum]